MFLGNEVKNEGSIHMDLKETFVRNIATYKGNILTFRIDEVLCPNGKTSTRDIIDHNGGVCVAPITEDEELVFIRQFRYAYEEEMLELPAGKLEAGEQADVEAAGRRELREETGAVARQMIDLGVFYPTCGYCNEKIYLFAAKGLEFGAQHLDADEFIEPLKIKLTDAVRMVMDGTIKDGKTVAIVLKLNEMKRNGTL